MASVQNGPVVMYKVNPYHSEETSLELPNCMYKVKPYHEEHLSSQQVVSLALKMVEFCPTIFDSC